jgi:hypothetical protein
VFEDRSAPGSSGILHKGCGVGFHFEAHCAGFRPEGVGSSCGADEVMTEWELSSLALVLRVLVVGARGPQIHVQPIGDIAFGRVRAHVDPPLKWATTGSDSCLDGGGGGVGERRAAAAVGVVVPRVSRCRVAGLGRRRSRSGSG